MGSESIDSKEKEKALESSQREPAVSEKTLMPLKLLLKRMTRPVYGLSASLSIRIWKLKSQAC